MEDRIIGRAPSKTIDEATEAFFTLLSYLLASLSAMLWVFLIIFRFTRFILSPAISVFMVLLKWVRWAFGYREVERPSSSSSRARRGSIPGMSLGDTEKRKSSSFFDSITSGTANVNVLEGTQELEKMADVEEWKARIEQLFDRSKVS